MLTKPNYTHGIPDHAWLGLLSTGLETAIFVPLLSFSFILHTFKNKMCKIKDSEFDLTRHIVNIQKIQCTVVWIQIRILKMSRSTFSIMEITLQFPPWIWCMNIFLKMKGKTPKTNNWNMEKTKFKEWDEVFILLNIGAKCSQACWIKKLEGFI